MALTTKFFKLGSIAATNVSFNPNVGAVSYMLNGPVDALTTGASSVVGSTIFSSSYTSVVYTVPSGRTARIVFNYGSYNTSLTPLIRTISQSYLFSWGWTNNMSKATGFLTHSIAESTSIQFLCRFVMNDTPLTISTATNTQTVFNNPATTLFSFSVSATIPSRASSSALSSLAFNDTMTTPPNLSVSSTTYYLGPGDSVVMSVLMQGIHYLSNIASLTISTSGGQGSLMASLLPLTALNNNDQFSALITPYVSFVVIEEAAS